MKMNEQIVEILLKAIPLKPVERDITTENGAYEEWGKCPICGKQWHISAEETLIVNVVGKK